MGEERKEMGRWVEERGRNLGGGGSIYIGLHRFC